MRPLPRAEASILSPLRYPGAKRRLYGFVAECIRLNGLRPKLFVEPFAGGASISLQLLNDGLVERVALGERDPLVASFWKVVFFDHEWLVRAISRKAVSLAQWEKYRRQPGRTNRERALACLFLNRTSFSGILAPGAGPIGGWGQESAYKIDCRFARDTIIRRIRMAARLRDRVEFVSHSSWQRTLAKSASLGVARQDVMYYLDPPFHQRAERLYAHHFDDTDHKELHDTLLTLDSPWLLSYDPSPHIIRMYADNGRTPRHVELLYSMRRSNGLAQVRELIVSNLPRLPTRTRLWRTSAEWLR
jgi:DNA adenine methylase